MDCSAVAVLGTQWGDEGKGKIVDYLAENSDVIVRYQGGPNAGHTVVVGDETFKLHHLPCGVISDGKISILGNGMVLDPVTLCSELEAMEQKGKMPKNLFISDRAHLIMPYHKKMDEVEEESREEAKIGTTMRGVGPAYADKVIRMGLRCGDLLDEVAFKHKMSFILKKKNKIFEKIYGVEGFSLEEIEANFFPFARRIVSFITDTSIILHEEIEKGSKILFEGAQGAMLDLDHGTYPYVTSSNPIAGGACTGAGVAPQKIGQVLGVAKAYSTRVGSGPFPTELVDEIGDSIREKGGEYGTTTGRPRRIGWLDGVALRYSCRLNGTAFLAVTLLDVLSGLEKVKIAYSYNVGEDIINNFPAGLHMLKKCNPLYQDFKGWEEDISAARTKKDLPREALEYLKGLETITEVKVGMVSVGPRRDQTIIM